MRPSTALPPRLSLRQPRRGLPPRPSPQPTRLRRHRDPTPRHRHGRRSRRATTTRLSPLLLLLHCFHPYFAVRPSTTDHWDQDASDANSQPPSAHQRCLLRHRQMQTPGQTPGHRRSPACQSYARTTAGTYARAATSSRMANTSSRRPTTGLPRVPFLQGCSPSKGAAMCSLQGCVAKQGYAFSREHTATHLRRRPDPQADRPDPPGGGGKIRFFPHRSPATPTSGEHI